MVGRQVGDALHVVRPGWSNMHVNFGLIQKDLYLSFYMFLKFGHEYHLRIQIFF